MVEDNTGHLFKITTSSVDLKPHLGHDVALIAHKASGVSPAAADSSFAVTELNMISEHCAAAAIGTRVQKHVVPDVPRKDSQLRTRNIGLEVFRAGSNRHIRIRLSGNNPYRNGDFR